MHYEKEMTQRAAAFNQFRELLMQQCEKFQNYLAALYNQQKSIESANAEALLAYVELEERVVADIFSIQKVIDSLENMYRAGIYAEEGPGNDISVLKSALEELKRQTVTGLSRNRELLRYRMEEIRREIDLLKNNPVATGGRRRVYRHYNTASLVDING